MYKVYNLFVNEVVKIFSKKNTYFMFAIVIAVTIGFGLLTRVSPGRGYDFSERWKDNYQRDIEHLEQEVEHRFSDSSDEKDVYERYYMEARIEGLKYKLENDIAPDSWKNQLVDDLYGQIYVELNINENNPEMEQVIAILKERKEQIEESLKTNDWRAYIVSRQEEVENDENMPGFQKELLLYQYEMMLEYDIEQLSYSTYGSDANWKSRSLMEIINGKNHLNYLENQLNEDSPTGRKDPYAPDLSEEEIQRQKDRSIEQIVVNEYRIKNNIPPYDITSKMGFLESSSGLVSFISMLVIIIVGSIAAQEYTTGTIKLLLISPNKRWKIWLAKFLASCGIAVILLVVLYFTSLVASLIIGNANGSGISSYLRYLGDGKIQEINFYVYLAMRYFNGAITLVVMASLAYMLSILFRNSAAAIGVGIFIAFAGNIINTILLYQLELDWAKYLIFANMDLNKVFGSSMGMGMGMPNVPSLTYWGSFGILIAHFLVFIVISQLSFTKTDVK